MFSCSEFTVDVCKHSISGVSLNRSSPHPEAGAVVSIGMKLTWFLYCIFMNIFVFLKIFFIIFDTLVLLRSVHVSPLVCPKGLSKK